MTERIGQVTRWLGAVREVRTLLELEPDDYADSLVLALIHVESAGDPHARRLTRVSEERASVTDDGEEPIPHSYYRGRDEKLEAMYEAAEQTVSILQLDDRDQWRWSTYVASQFCGLLQMGALAGQDVGFAERGYRGWDTTAHLLGDARAAIEAFFRYSERYRGRHHRRDLLVAANWKGGPGTVRAIARRMDAGEDFDDAAGEVAEVGSYVDVREYVERYRNARAAYDGWADEQPDDQMCRLDDV